ncbi:eukaryotic rRNA processing [Blastocladiella britannica]|nr:eukaryotic rRNA processing [Blastocladiella britannica]
MEAKMQRFQKVSYANDEKGLIASLAEFALPKNVPVIELVAITSPTPTEIADVADDLKRELAFYNQAHAAVLVARRAILAAGIPFSRPDDYFAEMVKTDAHMAKIRNKLVDDQAGIAKSEQAKKQRDIKKYGKQVQAEVLKDRKAKEKSLSEKVASIKKKRKLEQLTDDGVNDDIEIAIMSDEDDNRRGGPNRKRQRGDRSPNPGAAKKRASKEQKYGFGGKKRGLKKNDADSAAGYSFNQKGDKGSFSKPGGPAGKKRPSKRPGKSVRAAGRK